jgi:hypothetical protein
MTGPANFKRGLLHNTYQYRSYFIKYKENKMPVDDLSLTLKMYVLTIDSTDSHCAPYFVRMRLFRVTTIPSIPFF